MADLHERLTAAVRARMELARNAAPTYWRFVPLRARLIMGDYETPMSIPNGQHAAANDPATILRHCERDLRVLERHAPMHPAGDGWNGCTACDSDDFAVEWPCDEILDLAAAYGVEVDG